jgi:cytosine/uracil/thiamine/allantoin permease
MGCLPSSLFYFLFWQVANLIGLSQEKEKKKLKLWKLPKVYVFMLGYNASFLAQLYG